VIAYPDAPLQRRLPPSLLCGRGKTSLRFRRAKTVRCLDQDFTASDDRVEIHPFNGLASASTGRAEVNRGYAGGRKERGVHPVADTDFRLAGNR
jgi:hypothetical protein